MNADRSYRIILADDHALFLSGLQGLLSRRAECEVVGTAANGEKCLALMQESEHDVVLMDIDMPVLDGIRATERALALNPEEKIITLSMHGDDEFYFRMVEAGAKGFILKSADIDEVVTAIRTVCDGGTYFSQELLRNLVGSLKSTRGERPGDVLSDREKEILLLICRGMSNQEIADKLFISTHTVITHRRNISAKLGIHSPAGLTIYAIVNKLVELDDIKDSVEEQLPGD